MNFCDAILKAGVLVTQNPGRDILHDASLVIRNGLIAAIGPSSAILSEWIAPHIYDYSRSLVMPGLINAHTHAAMTFLRGKADDLPLMDWLQNTVFPIEAHLTPEIVYLGTLLGYAEMLSTGTTACVDMYMYENEVLRAAEHAGIRCMGGEAVFSFPSAACADCEQALHNTRELHARYHTHPRIRVAVNPHSVYTTTPRILGECAALANELRIPLNIHLAETPKETEACLSMYGKRPVEYALDIVGGAQLLAAHLVDITDAEAGLLARAGATGVHNPSSNMKLASGIAPVVASLADGLVFGLGTDGAASNNQLNMFAEMRQAAMLHKTATGDPTALGAQATLDMATLGGAACFRDQKMGALVVGAYADCIALDLTMPNLQPLYNPVSQIVYAATGHECMMTMIGGEIVFENGAYKTIDYESLLQEVGKLKVFAEKRG